jgi:small-conductance mechanosensitive channel
MNYEFLTLTFLGNSVQDYLIAFGIFIGSMIGLLIVKVVILNKLRKWAGKTSSSLDNFLVQLLSQKIMPPLYYGAFFISTLELNLNARLEKTLEIIGIILVTFFAVRFALAFILYVLEKYYYSKDKDKSKKQAIKGILTVVSVIIWGLALIILLDNLGFKVSSLLAGLGIGGIAIALAAQALLGDFFSYFTIFFDRPFEIGDFIIVGEYLGVVENIGIKTTRIRSLSGEQLVFSNTDLTNSRIKNYKRMDKRRIVFKLGVTYSTSKEQLEKIPNIIKSIIGNITNAAFDRSHFSSYGDFSLDIETVYYVLTGDYNKYMDIQQEINLKIFEAFAQEKIEFAFPSQTIYMQNS